MQEALPETFNDHYVPAKYLEAHGQVVMILHDGYQAGLVVKTQRHYRTVLGPSAHLSVVWFPDGGGAFFLDKHKYWAGIFFDTTQTNLLLATHHGDHGPMVPFVCGPSIAGVGRLCQLYLD